VRHAFEQIHCRVLASIMTSKKRKLDDLSDSDDDELESKSKLIVDFSRFDLSCVRVHFVFRVALWFKNCIHLTLSLLSFACWQFSEIARGEHSTDVSTGHDNSSSSGAAKAGHVASTRDSPLASAQASRPPGTTVLQIGPHMFFDPGNALPVHVASHAASAFEIDSDSRSSEGMSACLQLLTFRFAARWRLYAI